MKGSPLYRLLHDSPNDEMTSFDFRQRLQVDALLGGNGYAEIVRNGAGVPVAMYPLNRYRVEPKRDPATRRIYYKYQTESGGQVNFESRDILHIKGMGDGLMGWSVIQFARESIGLAITAEESSGSLYGNNSKPGGVLKTPGTLKPEAMKNLRDSWERLHSGPKNTGRVAILEQGLEFNAISFSPEDAQFIESRQFQVEDIARWFRVPPHKIGHLLRSTNNNIEHQSLEYVNDTLMPWLVRWEQEIRRKLVEGDDVTVEHLVVGLLRGDAASRSTYYRERFNIGTLSQNDIRELENENPIDGGDTYYVQGNLLPSQVAATAPMVMKPTPKPNGDAQTMADQNRSRLDAITKAHVDLLADAFKRVLRIEQDKVGRFGKKPEGAAKIAEFYGEHVAYVRGAIGAVIDAAGASVWALVGNGNPPASMAETLCDFTRQVAERHCEKSKAQVQLADTWQARASDDAAVEVASLVELVKKQVSK
jgi:HK97 family phage portal protein